MLYDILDHVVINQPFLVLEGIHNHRSSALFFIKRKKQPCGYFSGAVSIKAFAVALTTSNDRSSQTESIHM